MAEAGRQIKELDERRCRERNVTEVDEKHCPSMTDENGHCSETSN
jgi:hypothetical protein